MKKAFTLVELIFVIVITALIGTFGANLFVVLNDNYLRAKAINSLSYEVDNAFNVIEARLSNKIYSTLLARLDKSIHQNPIDYNGFKYLSDDEVTNDYSALEWIGQSLESKNIAGVNPGWSGIMDTFEAYTKPTNDIGGNGTFKTPGSKLTEVKKIVDSLYPGSSENLAVIFDENTGVETGMHDEFGFNSKNDAIKTAVVSISDDKTFNVKKYPLGSIYGVTYKLGHSAYAIYPSLVKNANDKSVTDYFDLVFYYNYQPWIGHHFDKDGKKALIAEYVTEFRYKMLGKVGESSSSESIIMKICMIDGGRTLGNVGVQETERAKNLANTEICKTRVVH